jgi:hypothetical protein
MLEELACLFMCISDGLFQDKLGWSLLSMLLPICDDCLPIDFDLCLFDIGYMSVQGCPIICQCCIAKERWVGWSIVQVAGEYLGLVRNGLYCVIARSV